MENYNPNDFNPYQNPERKDSSNHEKNSFPFGQPPIRVLPTVNFFEMAAWALGVASIMSTLTFYGAYVLGALAIIFALLSRGGRMTMSRKAKRGVIFGIAGMLLTTVIFIAAFSFAIEEYGSIEGILREFCNMYGYDFEEMFGEILPQ